MGNVALRPATPADSEFCFALHKAAMGEYVAAVWGWDEQVQRHYHDHGFIPDRWQIITADGVDVGALNVDYRPSEIYLARIELDPAYQGRGIGSRVIRDLLARAAAIGQPVVLDVLQVNKRALHLYQRLGFVQTYHHGPDNIRIRMMVTSPPELDLLSREPGRTASLVPPFRQPTRPRGIAESGDPKGSDHTTKLIRGHGGSRSPGGRLSR
jgi:GNAT superfamily N-acetyltransferase